MLKHETGWTCHGETITDVIHRAIRGHLNCLEPDAVLNIETHLFNVCLTADSCDYDLDVGKELWLNVGRWSRLVKEYVPLEPLNRFVGQAVEILSGEARLGATANFMFRDPDRYAKKHRWGGCLMGATFRGDNGKSGPATLTFFSRTSYMGYMALLDAAIANRIACAISGRFHREQGNTVIFRLGQSEMPHNLVPIAFRWYLSSQQLHCFKTLPYVYSKPKLMKRLTLYAKNPTKDLPPTWYHMAKWYAKMLEHWRLSGRDVDKFLASEKYGPFRRVKRRWCESQGYLTKRPPPSLHVNELNFGKAV